MYSLKHDMGPENSFCVGVGIAGAVGGGSHRLEPGR
jgi:hypothetical protein